MASRFWVGGAGKWTDTSHWSTTSGGAGGAAVPTSADDVFVNSASGSVTSITSIAGSAKSVTWTNSTSSAAMLGTLTVLGNFSASNSSLSLDGLTLTITASATVSITTGGRYPALIVNGSGITVSLGANWGSDGSITLTQGTFDAAGFSFTALGTSFSSTGSLTRTVKIGSGSWIITQWTVSGSNITVNSYTGSLTMEQIGTFTGGGLTYSSVAFNKVGSAASGKITDSNTFGSLSVPVAPYTLSFGAGTTTTVTGSFSASGAAGNLVTLKSTTAGTAWNLVKASGSVTCDLVSLQDSHASGGATFTATNATSVSGNTGWLFPGLGGGGKMFALFCWGAAIAGFGLPVLGVLHGLLALRADNDNRLRRGLISTASRAG